MYNRFHQPKVLVTGAAGFIGSHVADACLKSGMDVVATDDLSGGFLVNVPNETEWVEGDLRDAEFVASLWAEHGPFDYVYHLAAYAAEGLSHFIRAFTYRTNVEATMNLINQSVIGEVKRFVFTSSIAVYGAHQLPMSEDLTPEPEDPYGISKYTVELDLAAAKRMFGLDFTIFRPHNVYGERQNTSDPYRNVVGIFMNSVLRDAPMPIFGDGHQTRAFSHIDDVAPAIALCPTLASTANETYNIGADQPITILELAERVAEAFDAEPRIEHLPARNEVVHAFCDHAKLHAAFDLSDSVELRDGIGRMARWVSDHGPGEPVQFNGQIELPNGLPPSWNVVPQPDSSPPPASLSQ